MEGETPKPVKVGDIYTVRILSVGAQGDGVTKVRGFVVFIPDTKMGTVEKIHITEVHNTYAKGEKV